MAKRGNGVVNTKKTLIEKQYSYMNSDDNSNSKHCIKMRIPGFRVGSAVKCYFHF